MRAALKKFLAYLALERALSRNTISAYNSDIENFIVWLENNDINSFENIRRIYIHDYLAELKDSGWKPRL